MPGFMCISSLIVVHFGFLWIRLTALIYLGTSSQVCACRAVLTGDPPAKAFKQTTKQNKSAYPPGKFLCWIFIKKTYWPHSVDITQGLQNVTWPQDGIQSPELLENLPAHLAGTHAGLWAELWLGGAGQHHRFGQESKCLKSSIRFDGWSFLSCFFIHAEPAPPLM